MSPLVIKHEGYNLLHRGILELSKVEAWGMGVNTDFLNLQIKRAKKAIRSQEDALKSDPIWSKWRRRFGSKAKLGSKEQLATVLYTLMGYKPTVFTDSGKPSADVEALEKIDLPFCKSYTKLEKTKKALSTYLLGIREETVNSRLHPVFNLHTTQTYRSSSDSPNFQNMPIRDPDQAAMIRLNFVASPGRVIVENDFSGIEVRIAACYHKDPVMLAYINDPTKDMHRDMAAQIYCLTPEWVKANGKQHRYGAKNKFVFPQFYGDFYVSCAKALWEWIERGNLKGPDGNPLKEHLAEQGITKLGDCDPEKEPKKGTFEYHVKEVEQDFWNNRFRHYNKWKKKWYNEYLEKGSFDTLTGFRISGNLKKNQVINYPVQGSAFHCLLWSMCEVNKRLRKLKMKSRVSGQIHDSLIGDVVIEELATYLKIVKYVMTKRLRSKWKWINVPIDVEVEIAPPDGTWHDKQVVEFKNNRFIWGPKDQPQKEYRDPIKFIRSFNDYYHQTKKSA